MPDPNKKISAPTLDPCERNEISTDKETVKEATASAKPKPKTTSAKEKKEGSATKSKKKTKTKEKPSELNEEACPPGPTCQMARPDIADPKARVDKTKPGCIDFEKCNDEEEEEAEANTGCPNFEDCKDLEKAERKLKKQMEKEEVKKDADAKPCPKKDAS